jgi:hypothetical protein
MTRYKVYINWFLTLQQVKQGIVSVHVGDFYCSSFEIMDAVIVQPNHARFVEAVLKVGSLQLRGSNCCFVFCPNLSHTSLILFAPLDARG